MIDRLWNCTISGAAPYIYGNGKLIDCYNLQAFTPQTLGYNVPAASSYNKVTSYNALYLFYATAGSVYKNVTSFDEQVTCLPWQYRCGKHVLGKRGRVTCGHMEFQLGRTIDPAKVWRQYEFEPDRN
jgi:hypothetical protein